LNERFLQSLHPPASLKHSDEIVFLLLSIQFSRYRITFTLVKVVGLNRTRFQYDLIGFSG